MLLLLGISGSYVHANGDNFGAGFAGGLFGGTLLSAASSRSRPRETVYVQESRDTSDAQEERERERLKEKERQLRRKEYELERKMEEINEKLDKLERQYQQQRSEAAPA